MNNIFENAYFGKPYKTRGKKKAIYLGQSERYENAFEFAYYDHEVDVRYNEDIDKVTGKVFGTPNGYQTNSDIISEWTIDEEKINEMAITWNENYALHPLLCDDEPYTVYDVINAFKYGFRKAMEGSV